MRWIALVASTVVLLGISRQATADFIDGNQLYQYCTTQDEVAQAACLSYIDGTVDQMGWTRTRLKLTRGLPQRVTGIQLRDVALQWLTANPKYRAYSAVSLVDLAINQAWPACT